MIRRKRSKTAWHAPSNRRLLRLQQLEQRVMLNADASSFSSADDRHLVERISRSGVERHEVELARAMDNRRDRDADDSRREQRGNKHRHHDRNDGVKAARQLLRDDAARFNRIRSHARLDVKPMIVTPVGTEIASPEPAAQRLDLESEPLNSPDLIIQSPAIPVARPFSAISGAAIDVVLRNISLQIELPTGRPDFSPASESERPLRRAPAGNDSAAAVTLGGIGPVTDSAIQAGEETATAPSQAESSESAEPLDSDDPSRSSTVLVSTEAAVDPAASLDWTAEWTERSSALAETTETDRYRDSSGLDDWLDESFDLQQHLSALEETLDQLARQGKRSAAPNVPRNVLERLHCPPSRGQSRDVAAMILLPSAPASESTIQLATIGSGLVTPSGWNVAVGIYQSFEFADQSPGNGWRMASATAVTGAQPALNLSADPTEKDRDGQKAASLSTSQWIGLAACATIAIAIWRRHEKNPVVKSVKS